MKLRFNALHAFRFLEMTEGMPHPYDGVRISREDRRVRISGRNGCAQVTRMFDVIGSRGFEEEFVPWRALRIAALEARPAVSGSGFIDLESNRSEGRIGSQLFSQVPSWEEIPFPIGDRALNSKAKDSLLSVVFAAGAFGSGMDWIRVGDDGSAVATDGKQACRNALGSSGSQWFSVMASGAKVLKPFGGIDPLFWSVGGGVAFEWGDKYEAFFEVRIAAAPSDRIPQDLDRVFPPEDDVPSWRVNFGEERYRVPLASTLCSFSFDRGPYLCMSAKDKLRIEGEALNHTVRIVLSKASWERGKGPASFAPVYLDASRLGGALKRGFSRFGFHESRLEEPGRGILHARYSEKSYVLAVPKGVWTPDEFKPVLCLVPGASWRAGKEDPGLFPSP
jgi:hypothetical protein